MEKMREVREKYYMACEKPRGNVRQGWSMNSKQEGGQAHYAQGENSFLILFRMPTNSGAHAGDGHEWHGVASHTASCFYQ